MANHALRIEQKREPYNRQFHRKIIFFPTQHSTPGTYGTTTYWLRICFQKLPNIRWSHLQHLLGASCLDPRLREVNPHGQNLWLKHCGQPTHTFMWEARNSNLHNSSSSSTRGSSLEATVRRLYSLQDNFVASDRILLICHWPPSVFVRLPSPKQRHWIQLIAQYHPTSHSGTERGWPIIDHKMLHKTLCSHPQSSQRCDKCKIGRLYPASHNKSLMSTIQASCKLSQY